MNMRVERKKYSEVNMWDKVKWVVIGVSIGWLFYLNHQTNQQLRDRIDRLDVESSHHRTDIIGLNGDVNAFGITMTFHRNEINLANAIFKKKLTDDVEHTLGMMESKLKILEESFEYFGTEYRMKDQLLRENIFNIVATSDTIRVDDKKGTQSLQEQIDQLRLEFDELIQKLEEHKRTQVIFQ